ncbi:MAG TPA: hypothetical protein VK966_11190, partial [Longimicrobiales bacterium]|nr:hypothetical protein [Longimicrobiales bacterium]
ADQVLYVGKSIRLRSRLFSYFRADRGEKAAEIMALTRRVEWDELPNEFSALLREFRLIRRLRPPFNVQHKKERAVCFIRLPREAAGRILVTTRPVADGSEYIGPVLGSDRTRSAIRVLVDVLQLRTCPATTTMRFGDQVELFDPDHRALCARAELRRCMAPCAAGCTEREYADRLAIARSFLAGESDEPLHRLRTLLRRSVERWLFEYAAVLVERIEQLESLRASLRRLQDSLDSLTAIYRVPGRQGEDRLYVLQRGLVRAELPPPATPGERAELRRVVDRVLGSPAPPAPRVGADGTAEMLLVERWFRRNPHEREALWRP